MLKSTRNILFVLCIAFCTALGYVAFIFFQPVKEITNQKTDIKLTDKQLLTDFNNNNQAADLKYKNKIIELTAKFKKSELTDSSCSLIFDDGGNYIIIASCVQNKKNNLIDLKEGVSVKIKGIYAGYVINDETFMIPAEIKIDRCTLIK